MRKMKKTQLIHESGYYPFMPSNKSQIPCFWVKQLFGISRGSLVLTEKHG